MYVKTNRGKLKGHHAPLTSLTKFASETSNRLIARALPDKKNRKKYSQKIPAQDLFK